MSTVPVYILSLLFIGSGSVAMAGSHGGDPEVIRGNVKSETSGVIPGISRGAIGQQNQQGQQGQQGQQNQQNDRLGQMLQQIQSMNKSASGGASGGSGGASRGAGKGDGPIEIGKKASEFFDQATKANGEAFKQLSQSFQQSQDKNKPNPDNAKITEGLAEDQAKLAEANAKAPAAGAEVVADLIKGINEQADTKVKTEAQLGLQMAPPPPGAFAAAAPKVSIADRLQSLQLAAVPQARSTFAAGDKLQGSVNEAIPSLPGRVPGTNNIGHGFMAASAGASYIPERIASPPSRSRGANDDFDSGSSAPSSGGNFARNNFSIVRPSGGGSASGGGPSVFDNVGVSNDGYANRTPSSVKATSIGAIDSMISGSSSEDSGSSVKRRSRGAREQLLKRSAPSKKY